MQHEEMWGKLRGGGGECELENKLVWLITPPPPPPPRLIKINVLLKVSFYVWAGANVNGVEHGRWKEY